MSQMNLFLEADYKALPYPDALVNTIRMRNTIRIRARTWLLGVEPAVAYSLLSQPEIKEMASHQWLTPTPPRRSLVAEWRRLWAPSTPLSLGECPLPPWAMVALLRIQ